MREALAALLAPLGRLWAAAVDAVAAALRRGSGAGDSAPRRRRAKLRKERRS